jgi:hypothetical protein
MPVPDDVARAYADGDLYRLWGLTAEQWPREFPHFTPGQFLTWLHQSGLPDRCEDPATLSRLAAIIAT